MNCSKCGNEFPPEKMMTIENEQNIMYYFCISCIKQAQEALSMRIYLNKDERSLLKKIRKFLKHDKN